VTEVAAYWVVLATSGINVWACCDPVAGQWHHTKRVSMQRNSKREKNKLHAFNAKADFLRLGHMLKRLLVLIVWLLQAS
jgi:hypothetical protein